MQVSIRKLVVLPIIVLFISCSVTKRVHRPGFHIQWRKIERTQATKKIETQACEVEKLALTNEVPSQLDKTVPTEKSTIGMRKDLKISGIDSLELTRTNAIKRHISAVNVSKFESIFKAENSVSNSKHQKSVRPIFWRMSAKTLRKIGGFFIFFGVMFLFASMLVYFGAFSGNGGGAWLNFFVDLIDVSGWFLLLIFILVVILLSYLFFLFVSYVLGGPLVGALVGLGFLVIGIFFYTLGKRREIEA